MKTTIVIIFLLAPLNASALTVFIGGQSNASGRAPIVHNWTIQNVYLLNSGFTFEPAKMPLNRYSNIRKLHAQAYGFHTALLQDLGKHGNVFAVVNAQGGSSTDCWQRAGKCYQMSLKKIHRAQAYPEAIFWHQGESDRWNPQFKNALVKIINSFRWDLGDQDLPFFLGEIAQNFEQAEYVNGVLKEVADEMKAVYVVSSEGLDTRDGVHFDKRSYDMLGHRYYRAFMDAR